MAGKPRGILLISTFRMMTEIIPLYLQLHIRRLKLTSASVSFRMMTEIIPLYLQLQIRGFKLTSVSVELSLFWFNIVWLL